MWYPDSKSAVTAQIPSLHSRVTTNTDPTFGDSPAAFHIDGIYQAARRRIRSVLRRERVEVLSGHRELVREEFNRGTINVITNKPTFDDVHARPSRNSGLIIGRAVLE